MTDKIKEENQKKEQGDLILDLWDNLDEDKPWHIEFREDISRLWPALFSECDACHDILPERDGKMVETGAAVMYDKNGDGHPAEYDWVCDGCCIDNADEER